MQTAEYQQFVDLLKSPELKVLAPKQKVDDVLVATYWTALKDQPLAVVRKCMERHVKFGRGFPRPSELRPKADRLPSVDVGEGSTEADARCIRNLEKLRRRDPDGWEVEVRLRKLNRIIASQHEGSPQYEAAMSEMRRMGYNSGRWYNP